MHVGKVALELYESGWKMRPAAPGGCEAFERMTLAELLYFALMEREAEPLDREKVASNRRWDGGSEGESTRSHAIPGLGSER
jgi:hypothetical protein